jgi:hypothetical protein
MATAAKCGSAGSVGFGGEIIKWTFSEKMLTHEATSMASEGEKEYIGCLKDGAGSFESYTLCATIGANTGATFVNELHTYTADINIININTTVDTAAAVVFKFDFETSGAIT